VSKGRWYGAWVVKGTAVAEGKRKSEKGAIVFDHELSDPNIDFERVQATQMADIMHGEVTAWPGKT
jgi:hypothetical protein